MPGKVDLFAQAIRPKRTKAEIDAEVAEFLANGGKIHKLLPAQKGIKEKAPKGAVFLSDREERWSGE